MKRARRRRVERPAWKRSIGKADRWITYKVERNGGPRLAGQNELGTVSQGNVYMDCIRAILGEIDGPERARSARTGAVVDGQRKQIRFCGRQCKKKPSNGEPCSTQR